MSKLLKVPDFEKDQRVPGLSEEERLKLAGQRLIDVLELAEALPYSPKKDDLPKPIRLDRRLGEA